MSEQIITRPRLWGVVALLLLKGVLTLGFAFLMLSQIRQHPDFYESWSAAYFIVTIPISIVELASAFLIARYKRNGLVLGVGTAVVELLMNVVMLIAFRVPPNAFSILVAVLVLYYAGRHLLAEASKPFFT